MRLLVVEDEASVVSSIADVLDPGDELVSVGCRDDAVELLERDQAFDLVVCDLRIPPTQGEGLLAHEDHGIAVFEACRSHSPGTPVRFFSGKGSLDNLADALSEGGPVDLLGDGTRWKLVHVHQKRDARKFVEELLRLRDALLDLDRSVDLEGVDIIKTGTQRALRVLARQVGASKAIVRQAGSHTPGLSGADTLAVQFVDQRGVTRARRFVKVADHARIDAEIDAFDRFVPALLATGFTSRGTILRHGLRGHSAISYVLADSFSDDLFTLLARSEGQAIDALERIGRHLDPWKPSWETETTSVADMRRRLLTDERATELGEDLSEYHEYEREEVSVPIAVSHGDFHGGNLLVRHDNEPFMIDFGDVGLNWSANDPVTLELSLIFHPASPFRKSGWPSAQEAQAYLDLDLYLQNCPVPAFVRRVREWAVETLDGDEDALRGVVYARALRQLKYRDTDHEVARSFGRGSADGRTDVS
jgi:CheY-like chemotaxis protein